LQTEVKEEQRNLTINWKKYRNAPRHSSCYYGNSEFCGETNIPVTLIHGRRKVKLIYH